MHKFAAGFLILSGIAALTYQVVWVRLIGLSIGSTSASISTVLAAFFIGLAGGSYFAEKITRHNIRSLKPYILLELLIGATGLALLPILLNLNAIIATVPSLAPYLAFKFGIALLLLSIPTLCMGATFPVMAAILIRRSHDIGNRIGQLYSLNTLGAVFGAVGAGFIFIPQVGLDGAIYIAAGLNFTIALIGIVILKHIPLPALETNPPTPDRKVTTQRPRHSSAQLLALTVLTITGLCSIATEVGWTKYLSIFIGTTIYGFAAILGIFLAGIAAGSWYIRRHIEGIKNPAIWLAFALLGLGALLLLTRSALNLIPIAAANLNTIAPFLQQSFKYGLIVIILLPSTFLLGAIFPVNLKLYCGDLKGVQTRIGKAYAVNTLASIIGSVIAGFWIIPAYGTDTLLLSMALLVICTPLLFIFFLTQNTQRLVLISSFLLLLLTSYMLPAINYKTLITSVGYKFDDDVIAGKTPDFLFLKEGKMGVISLVTYDQKNVKVQNNGLNESFIDLHNPNNSLIIESLLAYIPYFLHDDPQNAFIVGYGGGITTRAFTYTDLTSIHVVELEPAMVEAGRSLENGPALALNDPRVQLDFNDARNTLLIDNQTYDLMASQPSHPWLAGTANVFTQEFFELVKSRLTERGIYSQWVNLFRMDVTTLRAILKAFYNVFPEGFTLANLESGDFMMLGSQHPLVFDFDQITERVMKHPKIRANLSHFSINKPIGLFWYFGLSRREALVAAGDATPNRDTNILSEVRLSALRDRPTGKQDPYAFLRRNFQYDLTPYLKPDEAKHRLYEIAEYFLFWDTPITVEKIIKQLHPIDKHWHNALQHDLYAWQLNDTQATHWYEQHHAYLLDRTHLRQAEIYASNKAYSLALTAVHRIKDPKTRRAGMAYLLYAQSDWQQLNKLVPQSVAEQKWQLIGLSQFNLKSAGQQLASLLDVTSQDIHQIQTLIAYYAFTRQTKAFYAWQRHLVRLLNRHTKRYASLTKQAIQQNQLNWAKALIDKIEFLDADHAMLPELHRRYKSQQNQSTKQ